MAGLKQALEAAIKARRALAEQIDARYRDITRVTPEYSKAEGELYQLDEYIRGLQRQIDEIPNEALQWGPDQQLDSMMQRYRPPQQMELDLGDPKQRISEDYGLPWE